MWPTRCDNVCVNSVEAAVGPPAEEGDVFLTRNARVVDKYDVESWACELWNFCPTVPCVCVGCVANMFAKGRTNHRQMFKVRQ